MSGEVVSKETPEVSLWDQYEMLREAFRRRANTLWSSNKRTEAAASGEEYTARTNLDAFVSKLILAAQEKQASADVIETESRS